MFVGFTFLTFYRAFTYESKRPNKYYPRVKTTEDYDDNGIEDKVIEYGDGRKKPMFGIREDGVIVHVPAVEMEQSNPDFDYFGLEKKLNEEHNRGPNDQSGDERKQKTRDKRHPLFH